MADAMYSILCLFPSRLSEEMISPSLRGIHPVHEALRATRDVTALLLEHFPIRGEQNDGWESLHLILILKRGVLHLHRIGKGFSVRKVHLYQHEVLVGILLEGCLIKGLFFQADTPSTPVTPGEIEQDFLVFLGRCRESFLVVVSPTVGKDWSGNKNGRENKEEETRDLHVLSLCHKPFERNTKVKELKYETCRNGCEAMAGQSNLKLG